MASPFASDAFTPVLGDRRGSARERAADPSQPRVFWWHLHHGASPRLADWLDDACTAGSTRLHAFGVNAVDWWVDAIDVETGARRRYALDAGSELEWLLQWWPPALRERETPMSVTGYLSGDCG